MFDEVAGVREGLVERVFGEWRLGTIRLGLGIGSEYATGGVRIGALGRLDV